MPTVHELRTQLQRMVNAGHFASRDELSAYLARQGLQHTRNGPDYVSCQTAAKERIRLQMPDTLRMSLTDPGLKWRKDGACTYVPGRVPIRAADMFTVYVLVAVAPNKQQDVAAYVGHTVSLKRRMADHFHGREGTCLDLRNWAEVKHAQIHVLEVMCTNDKAGAIQLEGSLTAELERQDWYLPGVTRWGAATRIAATMTKSFRFGHVSWSPPRIADVVACPKLATFKFFG